MPWSFAAALAAIAVVAGAILYPRAVAPPPMPPPVTLRVGTNWTSIDLAAFKPALFASVTTSSALRFRTDGQRLQLVLPGSGVAIHTVGVDRVEVRTVRGTADVTFTPQAK